MFLSADITAAIKRVLGNLHSGRVNIISASHVAGGSINYCYKIQSTKGIYFLKTNSAAKFPDLFLAEAEGLKRIRDTNVIAVPEVIGHGRAESEIFLILKWIDQSSNDKSQYQFGQQLAKMHSHTADQFGSDHDNYMGSLRQKNTFHSTWYEFFLLERIEPQLHLANNGNLIDNGIVKTFHSILKKLSASWPDEVPSLVHGDLWSGNYLISDEGTPILIDPAAYYGNREVDIAMSTLFGGFSPEFYRGYNDEFQLQDGWQERMDIWNLYPLLIHLNLFGSGYLSQIKDTLNKFV